MTELQIDPRERARRVLPGGYGRSTFAVGGAGAPYATRGEGARLLDDAGRALIDVNNNFTTLIHGHAHPEIVRASVAALERGSSFGLPNAGELDHAEALLERLAHADLIRYVNSGTEAVMTALRVARAHTGRSRTILIRSAYHGHSDTALTAGGRRSTRGLSPAVRDDTTLLELNDLPALEDALAREGTRTAAVLIDLMPNRCGLAAADPAYVRTLADRCRSMGIALVVDEVVSFRLSYGGRAADYGLKPDLTVLGKLIGGGLPVGAVAGRRALMEELDPTRPTGLEHGGTFSANPVTMAAGAAALRLLDRQAIDRLNALGDALRSRLHARIAPLGWEVRGSGSLLRPRPRDAEPPQRAALEHALWWAAYRDGVLLNPTGLVALSTPMDAELVETVATTLEQAISRVADGWRPEAHA